MSLVPAIDLVRLADEHNTAVMCFNTIDYNMVKAVINAAEKRKVPALVQLLPEHSFVNKVMDLRSYYSMVKEMCDQTDAKIGIHLDHCYDEDEIKYAIDAGFSSVMFDASRDPLDRNIERTRKVVEYAHERGVAVESELGAVGLASENANEKEDLFTKPETVKKFVDATHVDSLAIAIGNAHGDYPFPPKLDIDRLMEINEITNVPLVLHGGSGIPDDQLELAFSRGINKFNFGTNFMRCYERSIREYFSSKNPKDVNVIEFPLYVQNVMTEFIYDRLSLSKFD